MWKMGFPVKWLCEKLVSISFQHTATSLRRWSTRRSRLSWSCVKRRETSETLRSTKRSRVDCSLTETKPKYSLLHTWMTFFRLFAFTITLTLTCRWRKDRERERDQRKLIFFFQTLIFRQIKTKSKFLVQRRRISCILAKKNVG